MSIKIKTVVLGEAYWFYPTYVPYHEGTDIQPHCFIRQFGKDLQLLAYIKDGKFILENAIELKGKNWIDYKMVKEIKIPKDLKHNMVDYYPKSFLYKQK